jgi:Putative MetA-pathway of phenol degradation
MPYRRTPWPHFLLTVLLVAAAAARAQDIEPRAYSNAPIGVNFLGVGYAYTLGSLPTNPSLPLTGSHLATSSALLGYGHVFDLWGQSAKVNIVAPYSWLSGNAVFAGQPFQRSVNGLTGTTVKGSFNFYGAPAMDLQEFRNYKQDLILGASITVTLPIGQYDPSRLVNLGTNRWSVRPELGASKAFGHLTVEFSVGPTFFTDNTNFLNGHTRSQDPIVSGQAHAIYDFGSGIWGAFDAQYWTGGSTAVDGMANQDLQRNWRLGATLALPLSRNYSLKFFASTGVSARTNNNYDLIGVLVQYRWGAGL